MKIEVNKIVTHIDESDDDIMITTEDGTKYHFYHNQDCCEYVYIYDTVGKLHELVGKKLLMIDHDDSKNLPEDVDLDSDESYTWTEISFVTNEKTVISRWFGGSNGYYSESVDIYEIGKEGEKRLT